MARGYISKAAKKLVLRSVFYADSNSDVRSTGKTPVTRSIVPSVGHSDILFSRRQQLNGRLKAWINDLPNDVNYAIKRV